MPDFGLEIVNINIEWMGASAEDIEANIIEAIEPEVRFINKVEKTYLFPFKWIGVGMLGLFLDAVKAPGYVIGSIISPFTKKIN